jgi:hypothetical protein
MAQRRDRPPVQRSGNSIDIRLPDGTVKSVPVEALRGPAVSELCCFCGLSTKHAGRDRISISVRWVDSGGERTQEWSAHHGCLAERMHKSAAGVGPFFRA